MPETALSIVVPCFNEAVRLVRFEELWNEFIAADGQRLFEKFPTIELVFVNDGSRDATEVRIREMAARLSTALVTVKQASLARNQGKGAAVRTGVLLSEGEWVLMTDVDLSTPLSEVFKLRESGADLALGSRALAGSKILKAQQWGRPGLGRLFNRFLRTLTAIPFLDTQCGFKLMKGALARELCDKLIEPKFAFDVELILLFNHSGARIAEVPVEWAHQEPSHVVLWKDGLHMVCKAIIMTRRLGRWENTTS